MNGKLWIVATPIGNKKDITLHALEILQAADLILGEEFKYAQKLLKEYDILNKEIDELNEHNQFEKTEEILALLSAGKKIALISDHGTPVIADPGWLLVNKCYEKKIAVDIAPGVSSITTALALSGFQIDDFVFFSRIPRNKDERKQFFMELRKNKQIKVFIDAPYRLINLLENICFFYSNKAVIAVCYELTTSEQKIIRGNIKNILTDLKNKNIKGEFVVVVDKIV